ncbi:MAG: riboflavin biosynthesis protein RibF [Kiritimatiellae bacterium]|nr:riboflavin biosynthesis protein RibF [Kiritimatiellia bacterium]
MNLAVGFFDGVHLGHRGILSRADAALTFLEHPLSVLAPEKSPPLLMTPEERLVAIASALDGSNGINGVDRVRALPFTRELAAELPESFADWLRRSYPGLETVFCGPNWRFGAGGTGDADFLRARGFAVETVPMVRHEGEPISSTRIRAALKAGDLPLANAMLGSPFHISGEVVAGKGEGRRLGFPTINVRPDNPSLPRLLPSGVYVVETQHGRAVANWGLAPTMGARAWPEPVFEVHILETSVPSAPLDRLAVSLLGFLRPERRFASIKELREQIAADVFSASHYHLNRL